MSTKSDANNPSKATPLNANSPLHPTAVAAAIHASSSTSLNSLAAQVGSPREGYSVSPIPMNTSPSSASAAVATASSATYSSGAVAAKRSANASSPTAFAQPLIPPPHLLYTTPKNNPNMLTSPTSSSSSSSSPSSSSFIPKIPHATPSPPLLTPSTSQQQQSPPLTLFATDPITLKPYRPLLTGLTPSEQKLLFSLLTFPQVCCLSLCLFAPFFGSNGSLTVKGGGGISCMCALIFLNFISIQ
jgi:hypothetical protein